MKDKLRQIDEMFLDLLIGIILCGVVFGILGMIITKGNLWYLLGIAAGTGAAAGILIHMMVSIQKAVHMDTNQASRYMVKCSIIRYLAMLLILLLGIKGDFACFIGIVIGFLGNKAAACLQKPTHQYITRKIMED